MTGSYGVGGRRLLSACVLSLLGMSAVPAAAANVPGTPVGVPAPTYVNYYAPDGFTAPRPGQCSKNPLSCDLTGEPSLGVNYKTGAVLNQQWLTTGKLTFDDSKTPPAVKWEDVSPPADRLGSLDAILFTDPQTNRTFVSQLSGACSISEFSDNDGGLWLPSQGCGVPAGADHQTIGGGPAPAGIPTSPIYPNVVYYCSQEIATGLCAPSFDGGVTFQNSQPAFTGAQCEPGLHGHVKTGPDGTTYIPIKACDGSNLPADLLQGLIFPGFKGISITGNAGLTPWDFATIPDSYNKAGTFGHDPSIGIGAKNTVYYAYNDAQGYDKDPNPDATMVAKVAISHTHGKTWGASIPVSPQLGLKNTEFVEMVAGDDDRAAVAFLGTTSAGHSDTDETAKAPAVTFQGVWYLYVSTTYDGGQTWTTVNATPNDPVQRGCIAPGGGSTPCRNMLDFNDIAVDKQGRVLVAYTDGCFGACETDPANKVRSRHAAVVRQACGRGLFAAYDQTQVNGCFTAASNSFDPVAAAKAAAAARAAEAQRIKLPRTGVFQPPRLPLPWVPVALLVAIVPVTAGLYRRRRAARVGRR